MVSEINIDQGESKLKFSLINNSKKTIAVQVRAAHRWVGVDGVEQRSDAKSGVSYFPEPIILKANEKRSIQVRYKGNRNFEKRKTFSHYRRAVGYRSKGLKKNEGGS